MEKIGLIVALVVIVAYVAIAVTAMIRNLK
jgi:hypothetical protein